MTFDLESTEAFYIQQPQQQQQLLFQSNKERKKMGNDLGSAADGRKTVSAGWICSLFFFYRGSSLQLNADKKQANRKHPRLFLSDSPRDAVGFVLTAVAFNLAPRLSFSLPAVEVGESPSPCCTPKSSQLQP